MFLLIYFTSMILCLIAGFIIYKKEKNSPPTYSTHGGIRLKEAIMLWLITSLVSIMPLLNTLGVGVLIGRTIILAFENNDDSKWYNKRLKNKSVQEKY